MFGRSAALTLLALLLTAGGARAHRLEADYKVRPGQRLQVEAWFDLTGAPAREAQVQVFRADNQLLFEGRLDAQGIAVIPYERAEALRIVVSAGAGHVKELNVPTADLEVGLGGRAEDEPAATPLVDRSSKVTAPRVLLGVGLCLAVAGAAMLRRRARERRASNL